MDVFTRGICLFAFTLLVGEAFCCIDRGYIEPTDKDVEEFNIVVEDITNSVDATKDLNARINEGAEDQVSSSNSRVVSTLNVTNGGQWGEWGHEQLCPDGSYAVGYDMKIEKPICADDTALNAIKLICAFPDGNETGEITSTQGPWGSWVGQIKCPSRVRERLYLTSFDLQVQKPKGILKDDTAANYVKFKCRDRCRRKKPQELAKPPGRGVWGSWGPWSAKCPDDTAICGLKTKVEKWQGRSKCVYNKEDIGNMVYSVKNILLEPTFHHTIQMNIVACNDTKLITYMERACDEHKDIFKNFSQTYFPGLGYYVSAFNGVSEMSGERYWELIEHSTGKQYQVGANKYVPQAGDHVAWNLTELDLSKYNSTQ